MWIYCSYRENEKKSRNAEVLYQARIPKGRTPSVQALSNIEKRKREGSFPTTTEETVIDVLPYSTVNLHLLGS